MNTSHSAKGPLKHRLMVSAFSTAFGLLFYWLQGFIINDIGTLEGPDYSELEKRMLDEKLVKEAEVLDNKITETNRDIKEQQSRQKLLKGSIGNSQRTMDQLLDLQRLSLEKDSELSPKAQEAMVENIQLFLANWIEVFNYKCCQSQKRTDGPGLKLHTSIAVLRRVCFFNVPETVDCSN